MSTTRCNTGVHVAMSVRLGYSVFQICSAWKVTTVV